MKRLLMIVVAAALAALLICYTLGRAGPHASTAAVTGLLPRDTLFFAVIPDFDRTRLRSHDLDIYKLWHEAAVQGFLNKPLTKLPTAANAQETFRDFDLLHPTNAFIAVTAIEASAWKIVGGFHFVGSETDAEKITSRWRSKLLQGHAEMQHQSMDYQKHRIEIDTAGIVTVATAYDANWFIAANDGEQLKLVLDRIDGRQDSRNDPLAGDEVLQAALKHMPAKYDALAYARVDRWTKNFKTPAGDVAATADANSMLRQINSFCGTLSFEDGRMHDVMFAGMPKLDGVGDLARITLKLATKDAFLYAGTGQSISSANATLRTLASSLGVNAIPPEEFARAFGSEFGLIGEWPADARAPSLWTALPVKDPAAAEAIVKSLTAQGEWTQETRDGIRYFTMHFGQGLISFSPTIGLSDQLLIAGSDANSVEHAMKRPSGASDSLENLASFQTAERSVPTAQQTFSYIDTAMLYSRLDAALRPMLLMSAAFIPGMAENVDLNKLPSVDTITKHLSPIVLSQSYATDGYVSESKGPVTASIAFAGLGGIVGGGAYFYQHQMGGGLGIFGSRIPQMQPSPTPSATPDATP